MILKFTNYSTQNNESFQMYAFSLLIINTCLAILYNTCFIQNSSVIASILYVIMYISTIFIYLLQVGAVIGNPEINKFHSKRINLQKNENEKGIQQKERKNIVKNMNSAIKNHVIVIFSLLLIFKDVYTIKYSNAFLFLLCLFSIVAIFTTLNNKKANLIMLIYFFTFLATSLLFLYETSRSVFENGFKILTL